VGQMEADILALVFVDVDGDFLNEVDRLPIGGLESFQIRPEDVVGLTGRNSLGKLSHVIGVEFPADFLHLIGTLADFHGNAVHGVIIGSPDGPDDQRVGLPSGFLGCEQATLRTKGWQEKQRGDPNYEQLPI